MLSVFLPTIKSDVGYRAVDANLMTAPVYGVAYVCLLAVAWISDRKQQRGYAIAFGGLISGLGYILLAVTTNNKVRYGMCILATTVSRVFHFIQTW